MSLSLIPANSLTRFVISAMSFSTFHEEQKALIQIALEEIAVQKYYSYLLEWLGVLSLAVGFEEGDVPFVQGLELFLFFFLAALAGLAHVLTQVVLAHLEEFSDQPHTHRVTQDDPETQESQSNNCKITFKTFHFSICFVNSSQV